MSPILAMQGQSKTKQKVFMVDSLSNSKSSRTHVAVGDDENLLEWEENPIGDAFWPLVCLLRFFGQCPLLYDTVETNKRGQYGLVVARVYRFKWKTWWTVWSVLCFAMITFHWVVFALEGFTDFRLFHHGGVTQHASIRHAMVAGDSSISRVSQATVIRAFDVVMFVYPLMHIGECGLAMAESTGFADFLNAWTNFYRDLSYCFPDYNAHVVLKRFRTFRNYVILLYAVGPPFLLMPLMVFGYGESFLFIVAVPYILNVSVTLLEDTKAIMSYGAIAQAFECIRAAIAQCDSLSISKVKQWRRLILFARQQVIATGNYQKVHQLFVMASSVLNITCLAFVVLNAKFISPHPLILRLTLIGFGVVSVIRVQAKILAADKMTTQEASLVKELESICAPENELSIQLELKFIYDMIKHEPSKISFGNYFKLDKRLVLGIFSQVVTYLIALMQFSDP